jgi:serine/tyrosine/threonine adenylyltransferase
MNMIPQDAPYRADPAITEIADFLGDPVGAADFPEAKLRFRNDRWAADVGLSALSDAQWVQHFGRFAPLDQNLPAPLALRYHGHQFRHYNPDIGDGRGFLFAQLRDSRDRLMDLGTKGSGTTPYSRFGDGRLTLKGAVREILATEMLEALGVNTSKTFSVIETGESLQRGDEPSPTRSAVLVRLNHGHIRIGSFQRLATLGDREGLNRLITYALKYYYDEETGDEPALRLLGLVAQRTAQMAASFMAAGFVHGVLNSDNINISGESFDYGPWRFTPRFEAGFTAAYFDEGGLYAFGRQAEAIHWDVAQLAIALSSLADEDALIEALTLFAPAYQQALIAAMLSRLGVKSRGESEDRALVVAMESALTGSNIGIDQFFFDWRGGKTRSPFLNNPHYQGDSFGAFAQLVGAFEPSGPLDHPYWSQAEPCSMLIDEVEFIWQAIAEKDDWTRLYSKIVAIRGMGDALKLQY